MPYHSQNHVALLLMLLMLAGCGGTTTQPTPEPPTPSPAATDIPTISPESPTSPRPTNERLATVDHVAIRVLESFPEQLHVVATGFFPDGCTKIDQITQERRDQEIIITITTTRPQGVMCTTALVPFEEVIPLEHALIESWDEGEIVVSVNGVSEHIAPR